MPSQFRLWLCLILLPFAASALYRAPYSQKSGYAPPARHPRPKQEPDCAGKTNLGTTMPGRCSSTFWKCAYGKAYLQHCPRGLYYNVGPNQCDYKKNIVACGGTGPKEVPNFDCTGKEGLHAAESCKSPVFYSCLAGQATRQSCASGLVFDQKSSQCEWPNSAGCGGGGGAGGGKK